MLSRSVDSAARGLMFSSLAWLGLGALFLLMSAAKLVEPDLLATGAFSFGRARAVASIALQYGWLASALLGAACYVLPRVTGAALASEASAHVTMILVNITTMLGVIVNLSAGTQEHPFAELPVWLYAVLVLALLLFASNVLATLGHRSDQQLHVSAIFIAGASLWGPIGIAATRFPQMTGVSDALLDLAGINIVLLMWLSGLALGALYYVLPRASGTPLWSHRLALISFWTLAFAAPLAGEGRRVLGVTPEWVHTLAIAASIGLLMPIVCVAMNALRTLPRGAAPSSHSARFLIAGALIWCAAVAQQVVQSFRSVARVIGATDAIDGQLWFLIGSLTLIATGVMVFAIPRLMGRRWLSQKALGTHLWVTVGSVLLFALASIGIGMLTAAVFNAGVATERPLSSGRAFDVVTSSVWRLRALQLAAVSAFFVVQWQFVVHVFRSISTGEPRPTEVLLAKEVPA